MFKKNYVFDAVDLKEKQLFLRKHIINILTRFIKYIPIFRTI